MAKGDVKKVRMQKHGFFRTFQGVVFSDQEAAQDPHDAHEDDSGPNSLKLEPFLNTSHDEGHRDVHGPTKFVPIARLSAVIFLNSGQIGSRASVDRGLARGEARLPVMRRQQENQEKSRRAVAVPSLDGHGQGKLQHFFISILLAPAHCPAAEPTLNCWCGARFHP